MSRGHESGNESADELVRGLAAFHAGDAALPEPGSDQIGRLSHDTLREAGSVATASAPLPSGVRAQMRCYRRLYSSTRAANFSEISRIFGCVSICSNRTFSKPRSVAANLNFFMRAGFQTLRRI